MIRRGEIYFAQLNPVVGSEQGGTRPVLVVQNDIGNQYSPTTIVLAITSQINKAKLPTHIELKASMYGLERDSVLLTEQIRTIDKTRLKQRISMLNEETMGKVDRALAISLGLSEI
ncbi:MAG: type II toxin-antitoxin system PemK/MazF family toxin [Syntrophomonadaceae bacterium]|nr:type II toxin-antitoxin system PemK/MazF family toxin [Syntrophomonadaceae bacterium]